MKSKTTLFHLVIFGFMFNQIGCSKPGGNGYHLQVDASLKDVQVTSDQPKTKSKLFGKPIQYQVGIKPRKVVTADFDGNGIDDIAVGNYGVSYSDGYINVLTGDKNGKHALSYLHSYALVEEIAVGDFNNDNKKDIVFISAINSNCANILLSKGNGLFSAGSHSACTKDYIVAIEANRINADNNDDLLVVSTSGDGEIFYGNGGGFHKTTTKVKIGNTEAAKFADFNGDGDGDKDLLVYGNRGYGDSITIFLNNYTSYKLLKKYTVSKGVLTVKLDDFNNDKKPDICVLHIGEKSKIMSGRDKGGGVTVLINQGKALFQKKNTIEIGTIIDGINYDVPRDVVSGDFNGDSFVDLAVAHDGVTIILGQGNGEFKVDQTYEKEAISTISISSGHFNDDKKLDLVVVNWSNSSSPGTISVFMNASK